MFHQLEPAIPVYVENKGSGYAFAVLDYSQEHNLIWVTAMDEGGEIWCVPNPQIRVQKNWTLGRMPKAVASTTGVGSPASPLACACQNLGGEQAEKSNSH